MKKIDSVFGSDVPICAVNLKKLWCMYTCGVNKANYVNATGYTTDPDTGKQVTRIDFSVDEGFGC